MDYQVRSRPVYKQTAAKNARAKHHLFITQGEMTPALSSIFHSCDSEERELIVAEDMNSNDAVARVLAGLPLSTAIYLCGDECFIWQIASMLESGGVLREQITLLPPTTMVRAVFCCHCYTTTSAVTTSPAICAGCNRLLAVTDHFARRHGSYLGYQVNAEDSQVIPPSVELR